MNQERLEEGGAAERAAALDAAYDSGFRDGREACIEAAAPAREVDVERLRLALHDAGIGCKPNVPYCRATHRGHAERIAEKYAACLAKEPDHD